MKDGTERGMLRRLDCQVMYVLSSGVSNGGFNGAEEGCFRSGTLRSYVSYLLIYQISLRREIHCMGIGCFRVYVSHTHIYCNYQNKGI